MNEKNKKNGKRLVVCFSDKDKKKSPITLEEPTDSYLKELNEKGYGNFETANCFAATEKELNELRSKLKKPYLTKRRKEFLSKLNEVFADVDVCKDSDGMPVEEREKRKRELITAFDNHCSASVYVITKNGLQPKWFIDEDKIDEETQTKYINIINGVIEFSKKHGAMGDPVKDVTRILRIPGYYHLKSDPYLITEEKGNEKIYTLDELKSFFWVEGKSKSANNNSQSFGEIPANVSPELEARLNIALENDKKLKETWFGERKMPKDNSRSGYDMGATQLLIAHGFTKPEVVALLRINPSGKNIDASDEYLKKTVGKGEENHIYQLPPNLQEYKIDTSEFGVVRIKKESFEYQVCSIENEKDGTRATITLSQDNKVLNKNRFLLSSAHSRKMFANDCTKNEKNETNEKIKGQIIDIEEILKRLFVSNKKEDVKETPITEEEISEAEKLLKSPTLLYDIKCLFSKLLIAREEKNCLLIYLSGTSRILDSPVSLTGKGESSVGKSYPVSKILMLYPKDCYVDISDATKMSFYHAKKDAFKHKIIVLFEKPGTEQTDYSIRTMQSEKKLKLQITVKNPETGEYETVIKEVDGPVAFITTTTSPNIHPENETRCFSFYGDNSEEQTLNTFEMTDAKYRGIQEISEKELIKFRNIQKIIKAYPVLIPYVEEIRKKFPRKVIRVRRDYGRLLALIEVITVLYQFQRQKEEKHGKEYLVSTLADYHIAKVIAEDVLRQTIFELPPKSKQLMKTAKELLERKKEQGKDETFTIRELSQKTGDDYDTASKWFAPAFERGYFEIKEEHRGSKAAQYALAEHKTEDTVIIPSVEELARLYPDCLGEIYDPITGEKIQIENLNSTDVPTPSVGI